MKGNFEACLKEVLKHEGGYANHPSDPGGETMYGITIAVARANGYSGPMRSIPMDVVRRIYKAKYWDAVNGDTLAPGADLAVFDFAVNSGPARAQKYLASAVGGSDSETINRLCDARLAFLRALATWSAFGTGWSRRVADVRKVSLRMVGTVPVVQPVPKPKPVPEVAGAGGAGGAVVIGATAAGFDVGAALFMGLVAAVIATFVIFMIKRKK